MRCPKIQYATKGWHVLAKKGVLSPFSVMWPEIIHCSRSENGWFTRLHLLSSQPRIFQLQRFLCFCIPASLCEVHGTSEEAPGTSRLANENQREFFPFLLKTVTTPDWRETQRRRFNVDSLFLRSLFSYFIGSIVCHLSSSRFIRLLKPKTHNTSQRYCLVGQHWWTLLARLAYRR